MRANGAPVRAVCSIEASIRPYLIGERAHDGQGQCGFGMKENIHFAILRREILPIVRNEL